MAESFGKFFIKQGVSLPFGSIFRMIRQGFGTWNFPPIFLSEKLQVLEPGYKDVPGGVFPGKGVVK